MKQTHLTDEEMNEVMSFNEKDGKPLSQALREKANQVMKECGCVCHNPQATVMHMFPCCQMCYEHPFN